MFGMGKLWGSRGGREKEVKFASSLASPPSPQYPRHDYYSRSYKVIKRVGHTRPTPEIGAPTLVWHLSLWPERNWDPNEVEDKSASESRQTEKCKTGDPRQFRSSIRTVIDEITPRTEAPRSGQPQVAQANFHAEAVSWYRQKHSAIREQVNSFVKRLQVLGRVGGQSESFVAVDGRELNELGSNDELSGPQGEVRGREFLADLKKESLGFTLWWSDTGPTTTPGPDDLRVRVQSEWHGDFVTLSFYIDVLKPYGTSPLSLEQHAAAAAGKPDASRTRRDRLALACHASVKAAESSVSSCVARHTTLPEDLSNAGGVTAAQLLEATSLLYEQTWEQFCKDFEFDPPAPPQPGSGNTGAQSSSKLSNLIGNKLAVFGSFRGLVLPTIGLPRESNAAAGALPRFENNSPSSPTERGEASAVVKAFWPFVRRMTPGADYRDFIACGIFNWRAIYITALGALNEYDKGAEAADRNTEVPAGHLPEDRDGYDATAPDAIRYLLIVKGEPHRKQIGRMTARINSLGTMRLYALKDWHVLRNVGFHLRMRGQELDEKIRDWSEGRALIECRFGSSDHDHDERDIMIGRFTEVMERNLLAISSALDEIGEDTSGGLHYRINRSRFYVKEFRILLDAFYVGNIDAWPSYRHFVDRGLSPAFDYIDSLGNRLDSLRRRLQTVTEGVQTSALVAQASATRQNTRELKDISKVGRFASAIGAVAGAILIGQRALEISAATGGTSPAITNTILALTFAGVLAIIYIVMRLLWPKTN